MTQLKVGIIGGSGMDDPKILENYKENTIETIFGYPSDSIMEGTIEGVPCAVLARHARDHSIIPSDVNYRANIWALKSIGCTHILASTACGGLQDYTRPGDFLLLDQFLDMSRGRQQTLYGGQQPCLKGVLHMPCAEPFCQATRAVIMAAASDIQFPMYNENAFSTDPPSGSCFHTKGSAVTINGPRFSTRFESCLYRSWGIDVVNMTLVPEVVLALEAGLSYASVAIVTDYDAWNSNVESVSVDGVLREFEKSVDKVKSLFVQTIKRLAEKDWTEVLENNHRRVRENRQDLLHASSIAEKL